MATIVNRYTNEAGHEIAVYDSGMERDVTANRIIRPPTSALITPENANALQRKRWEKFRQASNSRIIREAAAIDPSVRTPADAYGLLVSKQFVALMDYDKPRVDELEKMGEIMAGGPMHSKQADADGDTAAAVANASAQTAEAIARIMADVLRLHERQDADIVEGKVNDE